MQRESTLPGQRCQTSLSLLMLDSMAEANLERAAVLGVFLVGLILTLLILGRILGLRRVAIADRWPLGNSHKETFQVFALRMMDAERVVGRLTEPGENFSPAPSLKERLENNRLKQIFRDVLRAAEGQQKPAGSQASEGEPVDFSIALGGAIDVPAMSCQRRGIENDEVKGLPGFSKKAWHIAVDEVSLSRKIVPCPVLPCQLKSCL